MNNKRKIAGAVVLASLLSSTAFSQITFSGYMETGYLVGSNKPTATHNARNNSTKGFGAETTITVSGKGKTALFDYEMFQNLDSDDVGNGQDVSNVTVLSTRAIHLLPAKDIRAFYTWDGVYGGEIARTTIPVVTERPVDLTGASSLAEFIDVTSGGHAVGVDVLNIAGNGRLSIAYNPNTASLSTASSDRLFSGTLQQGVTNQGSGASVGYRQSFGPITVGAGYTSIDNKGATLVDAKSKTFGVIFAQAPFAVGIQKTLNEGAKNGSATNVEDDVLNLGVTFAASKEVTFGYMHGKMDRKVQNATAGPDLKVHQLTAAYNLGPAVLSAAHEKSENGRQAAGVTVAGMDASITKVKLKVNF